MTLRSAAIHGVFWSAAEKWGRYLISFAVFTLLARLLDPHAFGLAALAWVYISCMDGLAGQGFDTAIIQRKQLDPEHLDTAFWSHIALGAAFMLLTAALAGPIERLFGEPGLAPVLRWLSLSFLISSLNRVQVALRSGN